MWDILCIIQWANFCSINLIQITSFLLFLIFPYKGETEIFLVSKVIKWVSMDTLTPRSDSVKRHFSLPCFLR